jgi:hypothetical protein
MDAGKGRKIFRWRKAAGWKQKGEEGPKRAAETGQPTTSSERLAAKKKRGVEEETGRKGMGQNHSFIHAASPSNIVVFCQSSRHPGYGPGQQPLLRRRQLSSGGGWHELEKGREERKIIYTDGGKGYSLMAFCRWKMLATHFCAPSLELIGLNGWMDAIAQFPERKKWVK